MPRCRPGDKPLSEPMMINLLRHICVTRPHWVDIHGPILSAVTLITWCCCVHIRWKIPVQRWTAPFCKTFCTVFLWFTNTSVHLEKEIPYLIRDMSQCVSNFVDGEGSYLLKDFFWILGCYFRSNIDVITRTYLIHCQRQFAPYTIKLPINALFEPIISIIRVCTNKLHLIDGLVLKNIEAVNTLIYVSFVRTNRSRVSWFTRHQVVMGVLLIEYSITAACSCHNSQVVPIIWTASANVLTQDEMRLYNLVNMGCHVKLYALKVLS